MTTATLERPDLEAQLDDLSAALHGLNAWRLEADRGRHDLEVAIARTVEQLDALER
jgi:hypothetical protein